MWKRKGRKHLSIHKLFGTLLFSLKQMELSWPLGVAHQPRSLTQHWQALFMKMVGQWMPAMNTCWCWPVAKQDCLVERDGTWAVRDKMGPNHVELGGGCLLVMDLKFSLLLLADWWPSYSLVFRVFFALFFCFLLGAWRLVNRDNRLWQGTSLPLKQLGINIQQQCRWWGTCVSVWLYKCFLMV